MSTEGQERVAALQGLRQVVESGVKPQVSWEKQFDHTVREVRFELSGADRTTERGYWRTEKLFQPQWVKVLLDNGSLRSVTVSGPNVLKSGELGARLVEAYYGSTDRDQMPGWLAKLLAEVLS